MAMPYFCFSGDLSVTRSIMLLRSLTFCCQRVQYQPMPATVSGTSTIDSILKNASHHSALILNFTSLNSLCRCRHLHLHMACTCVHTPRA